METEEQFQDWTFRYQYLYRVRRTKKQKQRFLSALTADIMKIRQDISVIEYQQHKKYVSSNLYVGNIETADQIICAYYDTPPQSAGGYTLFNRKKQSQAMTAFIGLSVVISLIIGLGATWVYMKTGDDGFGFTLETMIAMVCYGLYFYFFSQVAKGLSKRRNLVRNTSSLLTLLSLMSQMKDSNVAFAFIDEGCFGELGMAVIKESCRSSAKLYALDCVGAKAPLHVTIDNVYQGPLAELRVSPKAGQITHIFGARLSESGYYLEKSDINQKELKKENMMAVVNWFKHTQTVL